MIEAKIQPIRRDLDVAFEASLGPAARAQILASEAHKTFAQTDAVNDAAVGRAMHFQTFVDGRRSDALAAVRPDGVITRVYEVLPVLLAQIMEMLFEHSPVWSGRYQESHRLLADGVQIGEVTEDWSSWVVPRGTRELVFVPTEPYARRIDNTARARPFSRQAPDGVYHVVAVLAKPVVGGFGTVSFGYREVAEMDESAMERRTRPGAPRDMRQPAIIIALN